MAAQNNFERQFCLRIEELRTLVQSHDERDLLRISATLRLLLLDGLMHKANRRLRLDIKFTTTDYQMPTNAGVLVWSVQYGIYPPLAHSGRQPLTLNLDQFLAKPIAKFNEIIVTVKDAIRFEANVQGGVHVGNVDLHNPNEVAMDSSMLTVGGYRPTLTQLVPIGLVVSNALDPLYNAILS